jgi:hypothetical protein
VRVASRVAHRVSMASPVFRGALGVTSRRSAPGPGWLALAPLLFALCLPAAAAAQTATPAPPRSPPLSVQVIAFRHQTASDALALVTPLLSPRGEVELRPASNTLVVRDSMASLARILPVLYSFDHPARGVRVEIWLIRAGPAPPVSPAVSSYGIPPDLLRNLRGQLRFDTYSLIAHSEARGLEGGRVAFDLGKDYLIRFRLGTAVTERLRLHEFEVLLEREDQPAASLVRSHLNLWLGRSMVLALAAGEGSNSALMVVVRCTLAPVEQP